MPMGGAPWFGMMIVVPTFTVAEQRYEPIVGTFIPRFIVPVPEKMSQGIH